MMLLNNCLACNSPDLVPVLDLGDQPLANAYLEKPGEAETFPLKINYCRNCTHGQISESVDPKKLFSDYKYVSGTTETLKEHFEKLSWESQSYYHTSVVGNVAGCNLIAPQSYLEIGCNDGSLLNSLQKIGFKGRVEGVDPADNLRPITKEKGIPVLVDFWNSKTALKMRKSSYDVILALNCLAHNDNPYDFLLGCTRVLSKRGVIIIELPYALNTLKTKDLGQFYAEHHSYFTVQSMMNLVERVNLHIAELYYFPEIHGGTLRFVLQRGNGPHCRTARAYVSDQEMAENIMELYTQVIDLENLKKLKSLIMKKRYEEHVIAYGASAKSSTLFNLPFMRNVVPVRNFIQGIVDDNPLKQGLYAPGSNLKINSPEVLKDINKDWPVTVLLTVHNFKAEVIKRLKALNLTNCAIINYTPEVSIEKLDDL